MAKLVILFTAAAILLAPVTGGAAIDKLQKEDAKRLGVGFLRLYYNIGRSCVNFSKTVLLSIPSIPRAVAKDIFHIGTEAPPSAYYMTEAEKEERERRDRMEEELEAQGEQDEDDSDYITDLKE